MNLRTPQIPSRRQQHGAALVIGLLFLVLLTLVATIAMRQSVTQERMAGGLRNSNLGRGAAESALRFAERFIYTQPHVANGGAVGGNKFCSQGICTFDSPLRGAQIAAFRAGTSTAGSLEYPSAAHNFTDPSRNGNGTLAQQPRYYIEDLGASLPPGSGIKRESGATGSGGYDGSGGISRNLELKMYRITARATGATENIVRLVESTYAGPASG